MVRAVYPNAKVDTDLRSITELPTMRLVTYDDGSFVFADIDKTAGELQYVITYQTCWDHTMSQVFSGHEVKKFMSGLKNLDRTLKLFDKEL